MTVKKLWVRNVRCLEEVTFEAADKNLIFGENASGKTSLLEALFVLGRGRSFRGAQREGLIRDGQSQALISARVHKAEQAVQLGLGLNRGGPPRVRINGQVGLPQRIQNFAFRGQLLVPGAQTAL